MKVRPIFLGASLILALILASPAVADWLVLSDGTRVETSGSWDIKGRLVVFKSAAGKLTSLRLTEVDLEASEAATLDSQRQTPPASPPPASSPPPAPPVLVLTDADVSHVDPEAAEEEAASTAAVEKQPLAVLSWEQEADAEGTGVVIQGTLRNDGAAVASRIRLVVHLLGPAGEVVGTATAQLGQSTLNSGEILNFRARIPGVEAFETASFDITSSSDALKPAPAPTPPAAGTPVASSL